MSTQRKTRIWMWLTAVAMALVWMPGSPAQAAAGDPGTPDTAFDTNVGSTLGGSPFPQTYSVVVQPDGKILASGNFTSPSNGLVRFNADGSPDTAFNTNVGTTLTTGYTVYSIALQSDGKIVVVGSFTGPSKSLVRFNADGSPDTTFNTNVGTTVTGVAKAVGIQSSGRIIIAGLFTSPSTRVAAFDSTGVTDSTFNTAATTSGVGGQVNSLAVQSDDKIVLGGAFTSPSKYVIRLTSGGALDSDFNTNAGNLLNNTVTSVAVQPNGKILAGGNFTTPTKYLFRLNSGGTADSDFSTNAGDLFGSAVSAVASQADGKVLAGGNFSNPSKKLARLNSSGTPDTTFNTNLGSNVNGSVNSIRVQSDDRILVGTLAASAPALTRFYGKLAQSITFDPLPDKSLPASPVTVSATASSGLDVTFSSRTDSVCTVSGTTVTLVSPGTCTIRASQLGDETYSAATPVDQSFTVTAPKSDQTITFPALPDKKLADSPVSVTATASSGLTVSFTATTPTVCSVAGDSVTLLAAGTCTVRASQAGDASYNPAPDVDQSFEVLPVPNAPTGVSAVSSGDRAITVFWSPPAPNGVAVTGYLIEASPGNRACVTTSSKSSCTLGSLASGQTYTFTVKANSPNGYSSPSTASAPVVAVAVPGAVTGLKAVAGDGQATVRWGAPLNDGGTPIAAYEISVGGGSWQPAASPQLVTGLANGVSTSFRVRAINAIGAGRALEVFATPFGVPSAPSNLQLTRVSGTKVTVSFDPADGNGRAVSKYTVTASPGGYTCSAIKPSCTVTGIAPGIYTFTATATNTVGAGPASDPSRNITLP